MKNTNKLFLVFICLFFMIELYSQETITEAGYLEQDSLLWAGFEDCQGRLSEYWETMPGKRDSIQDVYNKMHRKVSEKNIRLAMKYASVPSGLQRLYMVRLDISKDTLENILSSLSSDMQDSFYGKNIREHLRTKQIQEGDTIQPFPCVQTNGEPFDWDMTEGKQLLILYGGLGCMGKDGREQLLQLYNQTLRDDLFVMVYWPCSSLENLKKLKEQYPFDYIFISDFRQDSSPIKLKYGVQSMPTCFLTDKQHYVKVKCTGFHAGLFNQYIKRKE